MFARLRFLALGGTAVFGLACGGPSPEPAPATPVGDPASVAQAPTDAAAAHEPVQAPDGAALSGEQVVEYICSQCHSMDPPALKAPPLTRVSMHLRQSFETVDEAVEHVVTYAPAPDAELSIFPPMARERFGLMPPQPLPEPMLEAAARYIWTLSDGSDEMESEGMGNGMMRDGGMRRRGGGMGPGGTGSGGGTPGAD